MNIILIGAPASGKGTQAVKLAQKFNLVHISTGDLLRNIASEKSDLADEIHSFIDNGKLVPDELIIKLVKEHLNKIDQKSGILFDGFPRTVFQAQQLEKFVNIDYVVEIKVSLESVVKRICDRISCSKCGRTYHISQLKGDLCECGAKLQKRVDDTEELAKDRYQVYYNQTYPIVEYYKNFKGYHSVDGEKSVDDVFEQICGVIK